MSMPLVTRVVGFLLILLGVVGYVGTGAASVTALIPAFVGALFLILALVARNPGARKHVMHAAVAIALLAVLGGVPRIISAVSAGDLTRPAADRDGGDTRRLCAAGREIVHRGPPRTRVGGQSSRACLNL
jgi:hypothetical protein